MRLLHHWTAIGYKACTPNFSSRTDSWGVALVELGFDYPFLLRGFLALSAVHKASFLVQSERPPLLLQADAHISQALEDMRRNLEAPSYEKSIPMFVLSSILLTYNFGSVQEMPEDPVGSLHHCFMLLNGIKLITNPFWDKLQHVPVLLPLVEMSLPDLLGRFTTAAKDDTNPEILKLLDLTHLLLNADEKADCTAAINELHWIAVIMPYVPNEYDSHPLLFLWAARASMRFFDLLAVHNPVACIITVHFAALLAQTRSTWWYVKWPRYLLSATEKLLQSAPDLLKWLECKFLVSSAWLRLFWLICVVGPRGVIYNAAPPSVGATPSSAAT